MSIALYLALARIGFQRQLAYRTANLAGLVTNGFFGFLRASVMIALFGAQVSVAGYRVESAVTFTGLTQVLLSFVAIFGWWDLIRSIRTGDIGADLTRPFDLFWYWCAQDTGRAMGQILFRGLPILILYTLFYRIVLPPTYWHWLALILSSGLALLVSFAWRFVYSLAALWSRDAIGIGRFGSTMAVFLSGFIMPVAFFPPWLVQFMKLTPFPSMINTPIEIWLGIVDTAQLPLALAQQLGWALLLIAAARITLAAGVSKMVIQGG